MLDLVTHQRIKIAATFILLTARCNLQRKRLFEPAAGTFTAVRILPSALHPECNASQCLLYENGGTLSL